MTKKNSKENGRSRKPQRIKKILKTYAPYIGILAVILTISLNYLDYRYRIQRGKYEYAYEILKRFNTEIVPYRRSLIKRFPEMNKENANTYYPVSIECFINIIQAEPGGEKNILLRDKIPCELFMQKFVFMEDPYGIFNSFKSIKIVVVNGFKIREDIYGVFNFFEQIAYIYEKEIADKKTIEDSLKGLIKRWHNALENFHLASILYFGYDSWPPLSEALEKWGKEGWQKKVNFFLLIYQIKKVIIFPIITVCEFLGIWKSETRWIKSKLSFE